MKPFIQKLSVFNGSDVSVLRLDLLHHQYGGNKYFKLKHNITQAQNKTILTFGGAHSNHIYSTAAYCGERHLTCIGVIRGEEKIIKQSPTLQFALQQGMKLHFISREKYRIKDSLIPELQKEFGDFYLIPEGGNNALGIKGCMEILHDVPEYDYVFCACGTGCTYTGILAAAKKDQMVVGVSVLKGEDELTNEVNKYNNQYTFNPIKTYIDGPINQSCILTHYHFGGYAKHTPDLLDFKKVFEKEYAIPLDYVYTSKLFYAVFDLLKNNLLPADKKILIIHSGGQQGNAGYEKRYGINT